MYVLVYTFIIVWNKLEWCYVQATGILFSCVTIQNACLLVSALFFFFLIIFLVILSFICSWWNLIIYSWYLSRVVILQRWSNLWKSNKSRMKTKQQQDCIHSSLYFDISMELFNYSYFLLYFSCFGPLLVARSMNVPLHYQKEQKGWNLSGLQILQRRYAWKMPIAQRTCWSWFSLKNVYGNPPCRCFKTQFVFQLPSS